MTDRRQIKEEKVNKKTLAIVSVYDSDGIIEDYLIFYLSSLRAVTNRLIVAVNGKLTGEGREKILSIADEIYRHPNTGFDFGAYKDVLENYLKPGDLDQYQELILCNDTCYGPFVPFTQIFTQMEEKDAEFWSINYIEDPAPSSFSILFYGGKRTGDLFSERLSFTGSGQQY